MTQDRYQIDRTAQPLVVEYKRGYGSPPSYEAQWTPLWSAKVDRVEINHGIKPSVATVWFPELRWHQGYDLLSGDRLRIRTDQADAASQTVIFSGFVTSYLSSFSGGTEKGGAYDRCAVVCQDHRWLLAATSPLFGQVVRGPDNYTDYGSDSQTPITDSYVQLTGRRTIFNANDRPNRDATMLEVQLPDDNGAAISVPIFAAPAVAEYWTAGDMIRYVLSPLFNRAYKQLTIRDPAQLTGMDHADFETVLNHVTVEGLNVLQAIGQICKQIGWNFREDYDSATDATIRFYKVGAASAYERDDQANPTILHELHAPPVAESPSTRPDDNFKADVEEDGRKMLWAMDLAEDITGVVNNPWGLGAPHMFEFTAELVPAWLDGDLAPDTSDNNANLFFTDADLQDITDPNSKDYYKYYHARGSDFKRDVGRKWALNEAGRYSAGSYDRGGPFDFETVIDPVYLQDAAGNRRYGPFNRQLLPCLTQDKDSSNSVGIKVEFSFDGGAAWQTIPAAISSLPGECGIYIDEANLCELADESGSTISGGTLDNVQLNYWTSLCDDKLNGRTFKDGEWNTRLRVTASVQMDLRPAYQVLPSQASGSPFAHAAIYDLSDRYGLRKRMPTSQFDGSDLASDDVDDTIYLGKHLEALRRANEDMSISGQFTLERLWLGDGSGRPDFAVGDGIERITGREYHLSASLAGSAVYPEIIQIIYLPERQIQKLITRDLRFAEVTL